jgi:hypothetical protein
VAGADGPTVMTEDMRLVSIRTTNSLYRERWKNRAESRGIPNFLNN